ncbi:phosphatidate cytidylyltransferase [Oleomonas cavernae]|uniref:Phosphatidate cytidylyltransferase n=1 Tax=Oleomonas cavernae TaxID=2320859 RepID=A0A418WBL7_9PROT|nr:phosphatidate cytidylyltransferase [Oleomonas cavernae]RJF87437.1 phosphatidate cytidylyltransferase [Oleomonas cavernae]
METKPRKGSDLRIRILSGVVLAVVGLVCVHFGEPWFTALVMVVALLMIYEWNRIVDGFGLGPTFSIHAPVIVVVLLAGAYGEYRFGLALIASGALAGFVAAVLRKQERLWPTLAVPYIGLPCLAMLWLRYDAATGTALVYWLLASIWATDTGAYVAGRSIGGPKLAPRISPKKTWAGLIGGVVAATVAGGLTAWAVELPRPVVFGAISGMIGAWSQVGDLSESAVKRHFGVKDSSNLIPGHGGFLDRLDGLLFAAPVAAAAVLLGAL